MGASDDRPQGWALRVRAAYHWTCGDTQPEIAQKVGRSERTVRRWQSEESWDDAVEEARRTWLKDVAREARATLLRALQEGDAIRAMQVVERIDPELGPAPQRTEITGKDGGPVEVDVDDARERLARRINRIAERRAAASGAPIGNGAGSGGTGA